jgi:hypothetical protein
MPSTEQIRDNARMQRASSIARAANGGSNPEPLQILLARIVVAIEELENRVDYGLDQLRGA